MVSKNPSIKLEPYIYDRWLKEYPKPIDTGPIELEQDTNFINDSEAYFFKNYFIKTSELPEYYAKDLFIYGYYDEYEGFKIYIVPKGYDYLLMGHHHHYNGNFKDNQNRIFGDHPHFHEIDFYKLGKKGIPETKRIVISSIYSGMNVADFLEIFLINYYIDDNRKGKVNFPNRQKINKQEVLNV